MKSYDLLSLGELLLRFSPPGNERITRGDVLEKHVGGAEFNVLAGAAQLGLRTGMISKLPNNDIAQYARNCMKSYGVSDEFIALDKEKDARLGIYYYENGAYPRKPRVTYDRLNTSIRKISADDFDSSLYSSTRCFHTTGITLALNEQCRKETIEMMKRFKEAGALISFDVNFRANLWTGPQAKACIEEILPLVDIFFCSESTARLTFLKEGNLKEIMKSFTEEYPVSIVVSTMRTVHSPKLHSFGSMIYSAKTDDYYEEKPYENIEVIDRIGSGDAYISGALYSLLTNPDDYQRAVEVGNAISSLKNTIPGDLVSTNLEEIASLIDEHKSNGPQLEMNR